jgi:oligosaccharide repeat unit polymerase
LVDVAVTRLATQVRSLARFYDLILVIGMLLTLVFSWLGFLNTGTLALVTFIAALYSILTSLGRQDAFSPRFFMIVSFLAFIMVGAWMFEVFLGRDILQDVQNSVFVAFCSLLLGLYVGNFVFRPGTLKAIPALAPSPNAIIFFVFIGFLAYLVLVAMGGIPILSSDPDKSRILFFAGKGAVGVFYKSLPISIGAYQYHAYASGQRKLVVRAHWLFVLLGVSLILIGGRGALLSAIVVYVVSAQILGGNRTKTGLIVVLLPIGGLVLGAIGALRRFGELSLVGVTEEIKIILTARPAALNMVFNRFDSDNPLGWATYFADFLKLLPGVSKGQNARLREAIFSGFDQMSDTAGINPSIVGEAMINAGPIGPYLVPGILGFFLVWLFRRAVRSHASFFYLQLYLLTLVASMIAVTSGLVPRIPELMILILWLAIINQAMVRRIRVSRG